jgi:hypothetical protein
MSSGVITSPPSIPDFPPRRFSDHTKSRLPEDVAELWQHTADLMQGRLPQHRRQMKERDLDEDHGVTSQDLEAPPAHLTDLVF